MQARIGCVRVATWITVASIIVLALSSSFVGFSSTNKVTSIKFPYVFGISITGYNRTADGRFFEQMDFSGKAYLYIRPYNSTFTEATLRLVGTVAPGIAPISMTEGWVTECTGNITNLNCNVKLAKLNTTNYMRFAERHVNVTLKYLIMNKYNYAWEESTHRFIGFFPFYVVPDTKMITSKSPPKYMYLGRTIELYGDIINQITGTWGPEPITVFIKIGPHKNVSLTTLAFGDPHLSYLEVDVIHHYVVAASGVFELPFKNLGGVYVGNYSLLTFSAVVSKKFIGFLKSIDNYPSSISIITWRWFEQIVALGVAVASGVGVLAYFAYRRFRARR